MRSDLVYAGLVTLASAAANAIPRTPVQWDLGGVLVPVVPALIGVLAALLVRVIVVTSPGQKARSLRAYNIAVTLLTMLAAATWITDHQLPPLPSFGTGVVCGSLGVSIIEIAKSRFFAALQAALKGKPEGE